MQINIPEYQVKNITFETYKKFFLNALKVDSQNYNELFYKKLNSGIEISFCASSFIVICFVSYEEIINMYKDISPNDASQDFSVEENNFFLSKFYMEYLLNKGIPTN